MWRRQVALGAATAVVLSMAATGHARTISADDHLDFAPMATDNDPAFRLVPGDLEFILKQIEISEAHAHAVVTQDEDYSLLCQSKTDTTGKCVRDPMLPHGLRTVDGTFNNLEFDATIGSSNQTMPRLLPIRWREGLAPMAGGPPTGDTSMCEDPAGSCYEQHDGAVYDTQPRQISNLIVDNTTNNPTVADAAANNPGSVIDPDTGELYLPNMTADEALSPPVNMWFVFFGQFFDHGLDLVDKSQNDLVIVPLSQDDPLWAETPPNMRWLAVSRATNQPGPDGVMGTADDVREHENRTTPWVDQNQTYTSHPSHQFFLREYELEGGVPVATGRLLNGENGGLATWNDVKDQALNVLGIALTDLEVLNAAGKLEEAAQAYEKAVQLQPQDALSRGSLAGLYRKLKRGDDYEREMTIARELMAEESFYNRACLEAIAGDAERAVALLASALEKRQVDLGWVRQDPDFDFIRRHPRFQTLIGEGAGEGEDDETVLATSELEHE